MQHLFSAKTYRNRRNELKEKVGKGLVLILANEESPMNYAGNILRYRQDSNFLYFFGLSLPGVAGVIDIDQNRSIIFGDDPSMEDIVWTGPVDSIGDLSAAIGADQIKSFSELSDYLSGRDVLFLPQYRTENMIHLSELLGKSIADIKNGSSIELTKAVISMRSIKSSEEVAQIEDALKITSAMHTRAVSSAKSGIKESVLSGIAHGISLANDCDVAYPIIMSKNGHILHNHGHHNMLNEGDIVVADMGSENQMFYASDITRTFPVSNTFSEQQKEIYRIVLDAEEESIQKCGPGIPYQEVHLFAAKILATGLKNLGLMKGDVDEAVAAGAHALFFPHGLGHMMGLDVHDMEDLGENLVGYDEKVTRSEQFGTAYLRLGRALQPGFVLTVEPGIYFIPELIDQWQNEKMHDQFIQYDEVQKWRNFGGIRIEDNVLITKNGPKILGPLIPKAINEIESLKN
jgi:Xaa-Pro aminopeptidase